jgi:uncharacterized protein
MPVTERPVTYYSEGQRVVGVLYLPADVSPSGQIPGIVLCHGFTGIKELILPDYGRRFAQAGLAALAFDYRGFGESDGTAGRLVARDQVQDIRNSLTFLETVPEVNPGRLGLWGTSYGAANVVVAAVMDARARCVVAQVGFADGGKRIRERPEEETAPMRAAIAHERRQRVLTGQPTMVDPLTILADPDSKAFFSAARERFPALAKEISLEFLESTFEHRPEAVVSSLQAPLLVIAAELDTVTPAEEFKALYEAANDPKRFVLLGGTRHYETYSGEPLERSAAEAIAWYQQHLCER